MSAHTSKSGFVPQPSTPACPYCGTTHGLRITGRDPRIGYAPDYICADCFTGQDDGPCFDDLEPVKPATPALSRTQIARAEYDRAYRELVADREAGRISAADASVSFRVLLDAYHTKKEALRFASFVASRGLETVFGMEG